MPFPVRLSFAVAMATLLIVVGVAPAAAQDDSPVSASRFHFGPLGTTPALTIDNLGVDNNVFNDPVNPKSDMIATLRPELASTMKVGHGLFTTQSWLAYRY